jgi:hypothetical protein
MPIRNYLKVVHREGYRHGDRGCVHACWDDEPSRSRHQTQHHAIGYTSSPSPDGDAFGGAGQVILSNVHIRLEDPRGEDDALVISSPRLHNHAM